MIFSQPGFPPTWEQNGGVTFQYRQHPWLQDPCHGDSPYFPCSVFRSERAPIGVWNGTLKSECCTVT